MDGSIPTEGGITGGCVMDLEEALPPTIEDGEFPDQAADGSAQDIEDIVVAIAIR